MRKDPDIELVKNFNLAKNKLDVEKTKYKNVQRNIVELFNECREIANKLPEWIDFDEAVDGHPSPDSFNLITSKQSFEKFKVDYIEGSRCFISDFKKSMQEGSGDQVIDFKPLENQLLENEMSEMKIRNEDLVFVSFQDFNNFFIIFLLSISSNKKSRNSASQRPMKLVVKLWIRIILLKV